MSHRKESTMFEEKYRRHGGSSMRRREKERERKRETKKTCFVFVESPPVSAEVVLCANFERKGKMRVPTRRKSNERARRGGERRETVEARTHGRHDVKKIDVFATASIEIECGHSLTNQWKDTRLVEQRLKTVFNKSGRGTILVTHFTHCATKPHVLRLHAHTHSRLFSTRNTARKNELSSRYR